MKKVIDTLTKFATVMADNKAEAAEIHRVNQAISILEVLEEYETLHERLKVTDGIWAYYVTSKGTGHTDLLKAGIEDYDQPFIVVIGAESQRQQFRDFKCVHFSNLAEVAGTGYPLAWDNMALIRLFSSLSIVESAFKKIGEILK